MTHGTLVGREREMLALTKSLDDALRGNGSLALIVGEPGIGKSRLLRDLLAAERSASGRASVHWGYCWEAGGAPAYWPWIQVLRSVLVDADDAVARQVTTRRAWLIGLLPELSERGGLSLQAPQLEPERARFQVLEAVVSVLRDAAKARPRVIVLEDLHAADASSLLLADLLARDLSTLPLLVLVTYRAVEGERGPLGHLLARLRRQGRCYQLQRLSQHEVESYLKAAGQQHEGLASTVHALSEGNPLFVSELAHWLEHNPGASLSGLPDGLAGLLRDQLVTLPTVSLQTLEAASVLGRDHDVADLAALTGMAVDQLEGALRPCLAVGVLEREADRQRFSHILVREAVYRELSPAQRWSLHERCATQLVAAKRAWAEVAHHLHCAGPANREQALRAHVAAADDAHAKLAFDEEAQSLRVALQLFDAAADARDLRADLLLQLGAAEISAGEHESGRAHCEQAASIARDLGDATRLARAALAYGSALIIATVDEQLVALLREALDALEPTPRVPLRAQVMARLAAALQPSATPEQPVELAKRAIALARELGEPQTLLYVLRTATSAMMDVVDASERLPHNLEHAALAERLHAPADAMRAAQRLVCDSMELGDRTGVERSVARCTEIAARTQLPAYRRAAESLQALLSIARGELAQARLQLQAARDWVRSDDPNACRTVVLQELELLHREGRHRDAVAKLPELDQVFASGGVAIQLADLVAARALAHAGQPALARRRLSSIDAPMLLGLGDASMLQPYIEAYVALEHAPLAAETTRELAPLAAEVARKLAPRTGRFVSWGVLGMLWGPPIDWVRSLALQLAGQPQLAMDCMRAAKQQAEAAGLTYYATQCERLLQAQSADTSRGASNAETLASSQAQPTPGPVIDFSLRKNGESWLVEHARRSFVLKDGKGIAMLAQLVSNPGTALHVLELSEASDTGDAGELLDSAAKTAYRARIQALRHDLNEAEHCNDLGRAARARDELDQLSTELARAFGVGGRKRKAGAAAERARVNVQRRVRDAIKRIQAQDAPLGRHLSWAVRTGTYCCYEPER